MLRSYFPRRILSRFVVRGVAALALAGALFVPTLTQAQGGKAKKTAGHMEKKTGKVADVEKKSKASTLLTVEEKDGEKFEIILSGKLKFLIKAKGDAGFLKSPEVFVASDKVFTANNKLFGKQFTAYVGKNTPPPRAEPDPANAEVYHVAGQIVDCDDASFTINVGGAPYTVNLEQGAGLDVALEVTDFEHAPLAVGSEIEVEGKTRGGRFLAESVVVTIDKTLTVDDVFGKGDKKPGKKPGAGAKVARKTAKSDKGEPADKGDEASADALKPSGADPFNVLDKKDAGDKKDAKKKPAGGKPKAKKPADDMDQ